MTPLSQEEIEKARQAGKVMREIFDGLRERIIPDVTTKSLDLWVENEITRRGLKVAYHEPEVNFPGSICISVNSEVVHGVPDEYILQKGDVAKFDLVVDYEGIKVDSAFTVVVGEEATGAKKHLLSTVEKALFAGIEAIKGPVKTGEISAAVEKVLKKGGLGIVRELQGHGIGQKQWEAPDIPNFGKKSDGVMVPVGRLLAIEPMAALGKGAIILDEDDEWTYKMRDGSLAAHFEHTVLITENGAEILTK